MSALDPMLAGLRDPEEATRCYAAEEIGYLDAADGLQALVECLGREPSRREQDAIFQALTRLKADAVIEAAIELMKSKEPSIRNEAVNLLRRKGSRTIPFLTETMKTGDQNLRKLVLDVVSSHPGTETDAIYALALADVDVNVVITAVHNLGNLRAAAFRGKIEDLLDREAHPMLIVACLEALGNIGHAQSTSAIHRCLPRPSSMPGFLLPSYLRAMDALGADLPLDELCACLGSDMAVGSEAGSAVLDSILLALSRDQGVAAGDEILDRIFPVLRTMIESAENPRSSCQVLRVLGHWKSKEHVYPSLVSNLSDSRRYVRLAAVEILLTCNQADARSILIAHAGTESDSEILALLAARCILKTDAEASR